MPINYPLSLPSSPSFKRLEIREVNVVGVSESPTSFEQQVYEWDGDRWEVGVTYPIMTRVYGDPVVAVLSALRGRRGTLLIGNPKAATPRGSAPGTPFVWGDQTQRSNTMTTRGWTPSQTGILKAGDHFQVCKNQLSSPVGIDNAAWTKNQCTVSADTIVAPDGNTTADRITPTGGATDVYVRQNGANADVAGKTFVFYVWLKAASGSPTVRIAITNQADSAVVSSTLTLTTSWVLYSVTGTMATTDTAVKAYIGGATTWVEAEGAVDAWGASLTCSALDTTLHKNLTDVDSNGGGTATLDIWPKQRIAMGDFSRIITSSPKLLARMASNKRAYSIDEAGNYTVAFELVEAL